MCLGTCGRRLSTYLPRLLRLLMMRFVNKILISFILFLFLFQALSFFQQAEESKTDCNYVSLLCAPNFQCIFVIYSLCLSPLPLFSLSLSLPTSLPISQLIPASIAVTGCTLGSVTSILERKKRLKNGYARQLIIKAM